MAVGRWPARGQLAHAVSRTPEGLEVSRNVGLPERRRFRRQAESAVEVAQWNIQVTPKGSCTTPK